MIDGPKFHRTAAKMAPTWLFLLVHDPKDYVLLGLPRDSNAAVKWSAPGGPMALGEDLADAFTRISSTVLGKTFTRCLAASNGVFEIADEGGDRAVGPSQICIVYDVSVESREAVKLSQSEYSDQRWEHAAGVPRDEEVDHRTRLFFTNPIPPVEQYQLVSARRDASMAQAWQAPMLSLTAQAFLFTIALDASASTGARRLAAALAATSALAAVQLLMRHRRFETADAIWLTRYERRMRSSGYQQVSDRLFRDRLVGLATPAGRASRPWKLLHPSEWSSHALWRAVLLVFAAVGLFVAVAPDALHGSAASVCDSASPVSERAMAPTPAAPGSAPSDKEVVPNSRGAGPAVGTEDRKGAASESQKVRSDEKGAEAARSGGVQHQ